MTDLLLLLLPPPMLRSDLRNDMDGRVTRMLSPTAGMELVSNKVVVA